MASNTHKAMKMFIDLHLKKYYRVNNRSFPIAEKVRIIKINDPDSKNLIDYEPDYAIKRNVSRHSYYYIVFEIIDSQKDIKTMADIARILAVPEIKKVIFISCSKEKGEETDRIISALIGAYKSRFRKKRKEVMDIVSKEVLPSDTVENIYKMLFKELKSYFPSE